MQLGVLGPVELAEGGRRVALGGVKQRIVLGMLAASRGRVVPIEELIDGLWPEGPRAQPRKTVQVYVTRLRQALGSCAAAIGSEASGYRFDPALVPVDADAFADAVRQAERDPDDHRASRALRRALALWRGDAFVDLRDCPAIVPSAVALDEERLRTTHELFEREIRLRPHDVIAELEAALSAHPLDEGFAAHLMTAQYRIGRQADALATYRALRRRLAEELGVDPSPFVRELQGRILRHELDVVRVPLAGQAARQRRRVTALAVEFRFPCHDALDPEDELALVAPVRAVVRATVLDHGGIVLGEGGEHLTACFGYPSTKGSAARAVTAALAIRDLAAEQAPGVAVAVGVDTGEVVVEEVQPGTPSAITGEPVRSAGRWRTIAPDGDVLVGPATATAVAGDIELEPTVERSSPAAPVRALAVRSERVRTDLPELIGRDVALAELRALAAASEHRLCPVLVSGPSGIGKTAFVESFVAALGPGWSVVWIHGDNRAAASPWASLRPLLADGDDDSEPSARHVATVLAERWAGRRGVLVAEAVDAMDPATLEVLGALADHVASGLLLLTAREPEAVVELNGEAVPAVRLRPLDRTETRRLVQQRARPGRLRPDVVHDIVERSGGVPLHAVALAEALRAGEPGARAVPLTLYESVMGVLDRLGPARVVAQRCAALGVRFRAEDLSLVTDDALSLVDVEAHVARLVAAGVLRWLEDGFCFTSEVVADTAHDALLVRDRAALHARIADGLPRDLIATDPARRAFHLEASGRPAEAASAWCKASGAAIVRLRYVEAASLARRALAQLDAAGDAADARTDVVRQRALLNLAVALQGGRHGSVELDAVIAEARARGVGEGPGDIARSSLLSTVEVSNLHALGDFAGAEQAARRALDVAAAGDDERAETLAHQFLGATLVWRGELDACEVELRRAATAWEEGLDPGPFTTRPLVAMWTLLALVGTFRGDEEAAAAAMARARQVAPSGDGYARCMVETMSSIVDQVAGRTDLDRSALESTWELAMELGSEFWTTWSQVLLGWAVAVEDPERGVALMAEAVETSSTRQMLPYFEYLLGTRLAEHGQLGAGLARLDQGISVAEETGEGLWLRLLHAARDEWRVGASPSTDSKAVS